MSFDYGAGGDGASEVDGKNIHGWGNNGSIFRGPDSFNANQRIRLQLDAIASESLSGTVHFEMGESKWGVGRQGSALGADGTIIELKQAYIDWIIPNSELKVRMGIQPFTLPSKSTYGSMILTDDAAGIALSNRFNQHFALTLFWARLYNDNYQNDNVNNLMFSTAASNYLDNLDIFGISIPVNFDSISLNPWATYTLVGQNFMRDSWDGISPPKGNAIHSVRYGLLPVIAGAQYLTSPINRDITDIYPYTNVWHAGLAAKVEFDSPLSLAWDFNYGSADFGYVDNVSLSKREATNKTDKMHLKRAGFYTSLSLEYKLDWATPSFFAWYSSGDDADPWNGSERMPTFNNISAGITFSNFAANGDPSISRKSVFGTTLIGLWGLGLQLKDVYTGENLKHNLRMNYLSGTNHTEMARYIGEDAGYFQITRGNGFYLTTADYAFEFGLTSEYQLYEHLILYFDVEYLALHLDQSNRVWGNNFTPINPWNFNISAIYSF